MGENLYGQAKILAFRPARPGEARQRRLTHTVTTACCRDLATANTEFLREGVGTLGRQSQTWVRLATSYRIGAIRALIEGAGH